MKRLLAVAAMTAALGVFAQPAFAGYLGTGLGFTNGTVTGGGMLLTPGGNLILGGTTLNALYLYNNARDLDTLSLAGLTGPNCGGAIFSNHTGGAGCTDSGPGTLLAFTTGVTDGESMLFTLDNTLTGKSYLSSASSTTTHFAYDKTDSAAVAEADLNLPIGSLTGNALLVSELLSLGPDTVVVAVEDKPLGTATEDYNDLIFAFAPVGERVPEPLSLSLLGAGLVGAAVVRRRRKAKNG